LPLRNLTLRTFLLAVADSTCALAAYTVAVYMTYARTGGSFREFFLNQIAYLIVFVAVWCGTTSDQRISIARRDEDIAKQLWRLAKSLIVSLIFSAFVVVFFKREAPQRTFLLYFSVLAFTAILVLHCIINLSIWSVRRRGLNVSHVLLVGANPRTERLAEVIINEVGFGFQVTGVLEDDPERAKVFAKFGIPHVGVFDDLEKVFVTQVIDEVYISLPMRSHYETIMKMVHLCEGVGVPVRMIADLFPLRIATSRIHLIEDVPILSLSAVPEAQLQLFIKRLVDLVGSTLGLVLIGSWLFPIAALLIKLDSKGPVFFLQERVGLNQRRFAMIKFRSMVVDAEQKRRELEALNEADGPVFKIRRDPRLTRVGRFIRKWSIDELPQLINVWLGHMSLVGPRPPIPSEVERYTWEQRRRLSVKPGMTGLWQVSGRSDLSFREWVDLDLAYIDTWSLVEDFRILAKTFRAVMAKTGAA
jgi:exopolysaccharide biosynthesis polyprenyl glycosylphosphotransferase